MHYVPTLASVEELGRVAPGSVFEDGRCWEMVPAKYYRYEDRATYLRERYPLLAEDAIGVIALPGLEAMALYDKHPQLPDALRSGNHLAQLLLLVAKTMSEVTPHVCFAFFTSTAVWLTLVRDKEVILCKAMDMHAHADAVFHLASLLSQYGLSREDTEVVVGGHIAAEGQLYRELSIYFRLRAFADALGALPEQPALALLLAFQQAISDPIAVSAV